MQSPMDRARNIPDARLACKAAILWIVSMKNPRPFRGFRISSYAALTACS
jgi:hypothetical protein